MALALAAAGIDVVACDVERELLAALRRRAREQGLIVETVTADARVLDALAGRDFAAVIVPMQTLQLLSGPDERAAFYAGARAALRPGGLLAAALADALDGYSQEHEDVLPPLPDMREVDGVVYSSRPVAVREENDGVVIVRVREIVRRDGTHMSEEDAVKLARVDAAGVAAEAAAHGFAALPARAVAPTDEYVGSEVVMLRAE